MTYGFLTFKDASDENSTVTFGLDTLSEVDGSNYPLELSNLTSIQSAFEAVTGGAVIERTLVAKRERLTNVKPSDNSARESKWLVRYQDDVTLKVHTMEIPNADRSLIPMQANSDFADTDNPNAALTALITAINTHIFSPAGNAITMLSMEHVGRRL